MGEQGQEDPHYGEPSQQDPHLGDRQDPHLGETHEPEATGTDQDDMKKAGMRPTGSGGSAQPPQNR